LLLAQGLPALEGEAPAVAHSRKGGSPLDMLDRSLVPDKLPPEVVAVLAGPEGRATCMFTPDGASLLVGSDTGSLCFW
ncbi:WD40 repeat domain-containing protein, partial [Vibrio parahaemolyticus]